MSLSVSDVVNVTVSPPADVVGEENFATIVIFSPEVADSEALGDSAYLQYTSLDGFQTDFPDASNGLLSTVEYFFDRDDQRPNTLYFAPWDTDNSQTLDDAYKTLQSRWKDWYCAVPQGYVADPADLLAASQWIESSYKIQGITDGAMVDSQNAESSTLKPLIDAGLNRTFVLFKMDASDGSSSPVISALAWLCGTNFDESDGLGTLKFKSLPGVSSDTELSETQAAILTQQGINYYTDFSTTAMLAEGLMLGGEMYADEVIGLDWLANAIQTQVFNFLLAQKKVALTDHGVAELTSQVAMICDKGVNNGLIAPGVWEGTEFGDLQVGDYLEKGYYIYAESVSALTTVQLKKRVCPPITVAVKLAGAIHSVSIPVNTSR
jgi:hypothetical protein